MTAYLIIMVITISEISVLIIGCLWATDKSSIESVEVGCRRVVVAPATSSWGIWAAGRCMVGVGWRIGAKAHDKAEKAVLDYNI